ncbi:MAG TPA: CocE/NonD family hydrolase [Vicinamibacteria bacterium]|nr:CocE/NonD family hydrolase [Vicinamibacteria bacterium]
MRSRVVSGGGAISRFDRERTLIGSCLVLTALTACRVEQAEPPAEFSFGECRERSEVAYDDVSLASLHVPMRDGVRIAIELVLPEPLPEDVKIPAILTMTRYWRAFEGDGPSSTARFFAQRGYAVITGDSRGTGASFGIWRYHRSPDEVRDFGELADWIAAQPWSNGSIGGFGTSYTANTADWMAQLSHPAIRAIIPRFPDFDPYADLYFPGGVFHIAFGQGWGDSVKEMDLNVPRGNPPRGVKPVDGDDGSLVEAAVDGRREAPGVFEGLSQISFRDDVAEVWGVSMLDWSIHARGDDLNRSGVPMFSWGGWFDAGTAQGVLHRFKTLTVPQKAIIGPWSHGGGYHASPYRPPDLETDPSPEAQLNESLCYFDRYLKGVDNGTEEHTLFYYTLGEEKWKKTSVWPPLEIHYMRLYLAPDSRLAFEPGPGTDRYTVDPEATTGTTNRWYTQRGGADVVYSDRLREDEKLLTYTSEPLEDDLEVTGTPVVHLEVASTAPDGAFFVYLEDVDPSGRVLYITEGQLRALQRNVSDETPPHAMFGPYHSYLSRDAASPMLPGESVELAIAMHPTSVLFRAGHRIRLAFAGADKDTFAPVGEDDDPPTWTVERESSYVKLPVVSRSGTSSLQK